MIPRLPQPDGRCVWAVLSMGALEGWPSSGSCPVTYTKSCVPHPHPAAGKVSPDTSGKRKEEFTFKQSKQSPGERLLASSIAMTTPGKHPWWRAEVCKAECLSQMNRFWEGVSRLRQGGQTGSSCINYARFTGLAGDTGCCWQVS